MLLSRLSLFWKISIPAFILFFSMMVLTALSLVELWNTMHEERVAGLQHIIQSAKTAVEVVQKQEESGAYTREEAQMRAKAALEKIRYDNGVGYIFVYDWDGTNLVLPDKTKNGTNLLHVQDARGNFVVRDLIALSKQGGGLYTYLWKKPDGSKLQEKVSWVEAIPEWEWMLGTGIYIDDLKEAFYVHAAKIFSLSFLSFAIAGVISFLVIRSISKPMGNLIGNMGQLASGESNIRVGGLDRDDEVGHMARAIQIFIANEEHRRTLKDQLQKSMNEVKFNRDLLINAVNSINDGVVIFDESDHLILANSLMQDLYPTLPKHLENNAHVTEMGIADLAPPCFTCMKSAKVLRFCDCERHMEDGKWYRIAKSRTLDGGTIAIFSDITDYKKQNAKLQEQTSELVKLLQKEIALAETQREFVSMASHEFKTPLTIINGNARRIEKKADEITQTKLRERVGNIQDAVQRMQFLIERFLSFSSEEIDGMKVDPKAINLRMALNKLCQGYCEAEETALIHCHVEDLPEQIYADEVLLDQCISNIVLNAVKYSAPRSPVWVDGHMDDKHIVITVRDKGIGIAADEIPSIFKKYFRASSGLARPGTGIGLNFAKMVIHEHGGDIQVESVLGKGSCFTILLPIELVGKHVSGSISQVRKAS